MMSLSLGAQGWICSASKGSLINHCMGWFYYLEKCTCEDGSCRVWEISQGEVGLLEGPNTQLSAVGSSATNTKVDRQCRGCW